ncbi:MAG: putative toxin-antitoxin system toxin component, PIN family [Treponema sp.]|nr:putative toxin-antitoxin system toxin component, PIN family [Treponema sp.]
MKKYVVVDTNVLVSALITRNESSPTVKILRYIADNKIIPVFSEEIIREYNEVLHRAKFKLPDEIIINLLNDIIKYGYEVKETVKVEESMPDPKDINFYAVTLTTSDKESVLVTGNSKHFPVKPFVVSPAELINLMEK